MSGPSAALVDEAARTAVTTAIERTVVVEAGAGSGKTTAIVDRIVTLVGAGTPIDAIVAVTFTEAAAADLRSRVRARLEGIVAEGGEAGAAALDGLRALDGAMIGTVHAWARRIVAEDPGAVGVPPNFDVLDEVQTSLVRARSWRALLDDLLGDPTLARSVAALDAVQFRPGRLREVHELLCDHLDRLEAHGAALDGGEIRPVVVDVDDVLAAAETAVGYASGCSDPDDKLLARLRVVDEAARRLRSLPDDLDRLELLNAPWAKEGRKVGRKQRWPDKDAVLDALAALRDAAATAREQAIGVAVANVVSRMVAHVRADALARRREGELEFADLLLLARDLLRRSSGARRRLHERTAVVVVDELQDTDPLQIELAVLVATDVDEVGETPWWELPVPPGALVVVGDPKQSIYRFRRADLRVFRRIVDVHAEGHVSFTTNFRSRPGILAWVDACIGPQLAAGAEAAPDLQARHLPLAPRRPVTDGDPPVLLLDGDPTDSLATAREQEAADVAAVLQEVAEGHFRVGGAEGTSRVARLGDVAILLPTRITLPYLEHALARAEIPARIESETLVLATDAVRELLVILEALADPTDAVATVAALRTPTLACADDDLARHALAGGGWDYLAPDLSDEAPDDVRRGLAWLHEHHGRVALLTVDAAVEHVIRAGRLLELGLAHRRPRDHWRRVLHVADLARAFTEAGGTTLRELVAWLRDRAEHELRTVEVPVPEPDDDAVRILTVHGAKGLEFPITILAGLNVADRTPSEAVVWRDDREPVLGGRPVRPPDYAALSDVERAADAAEAVRLLYVAATRARDHLVVCLHRSTGSSAAQRLAAAAEACPQLWTTRSPGRTSETTETTERPDRHDDTRGAPPPVGDAGERTDGDLDRRLARHRSAVASGSGAAAIAATTIARTDDAHGTPEVEPEGGSLRRGRAGTAIGRAVHATLQTVDLATGEGLAASAHAQAHAEGVPELAEEVAALAASALRAPSVRAACQGGRWWREVPVGAAIDGTVLEGFVDLLVETPEGLVVVDYKTDRLAHPDDVADHVARYRLQGAAYALALEAALARPVLRCTFVFTRLPEPVEHDIEDLRGAVDDARARLRSLAGAGDL